MERKIHSAVYLLVIAFGGQGCVFAPGMQYGDGGLSNQDYQVAGTKEASLAGIDKIELTAKTIALQSQDSISIPSVLLNYHPEQYHLGPFDGVSLILWDHPEITAPGGSDSLLVRTIDAAGNLFVPYAGNLHVGGLTVDQARQQITTKISQYIENPQVDIVVSNFGSKRFTVGGEVVDPGLKALSNQPINLLDAIGMGGGFTSNADRTHVILVRDNSRYILNLAGLMQKKSAEIANVYIKPGDVVQVSDNASQQVYMIGELSRPEAIPLTAHGLTLGDALGRAGGLSVTTSDPSSIYIIRAHDIKDGTIGRVYHLDASSPAALALADKFELRPKDFVFVGAAAVTRWNRVISQLLPSASLINSASDTRNDLDEN